MIMNQKSFFLERKNCRICSSAIEIINSLGDLASSGAFPSTTNEFVPIGPLTLGKCSECGLVQLCHDFDKKILYTDQYGYRSGINETMVTHLKTLAEDVLDKHYKSSKIISQEKLNDSTTLTLVDIGSNDATFLNEINRIAKYKCKLIGIDPSAEQFMELYEHSGFSLQTELFSVDIANLSLNGKKANIVTSIAMFYDLENPVKFAADVSQILDPEGFWVLEQSYLPLMVKQNAFDTICHEHLEYYTLNDVLNICKRVGLRVFDVELNSSNGGSFRLYVSHEGSKTHSVSSNILKVLDAEKHIVNDRDSLDNFFTSILQIKEQCNLKLNQLTSKGLLIHGYGASTKGNTLLQYFGINKELIPVIAERNSKKFQKFTPNTHIKIISEAESRVMRPDYFFVLPWHFKSSIIKREKLIRIDQKFIFPLPQFELI